MRQHFSNSELTDPPPSRLCQILAMPGGFTKDQAVTRAMLNIEHMRAAALDDLASKIAQLHGGMFEFGVMCLSAQQMQVVSSRLENILNVAGQLGLSHLTAAASLLFDMLQSPIGRLRLTPDSFRAFVHAMHLFSHRRGHYHEDGMVILSQIERLYELAAPVDAKARA